MAFLFQVTISLGQYSSSNPQYPWGNWTQNNCFKGIYIRVQKAYFNNGVKQWYWNWQIQNRYHSKAAISWVFYDNTKEKPEFTKNRHTFEANEIRSNGSFGSETELSYILDKLCFRFVEKNGVLLDDCSNDPGIYNKGFYFANCDTGLPNYQAYIAVQQKASGTNSIKSTTSSSILANKSNAQSDKSIADERGVAKNQLDNTTNNNDGASKQNSVESKYSSYSIEQLENIILSNLKLNLRKGAFFNIIDNYEEYLDNVAVARNAMIFSSEAKPNTLYIYYHARQPPSSYLMSEKFADLNVEKLTSKERSLLYFKTKWDDRKNRSPLADHKPALFLYDFGVNDQNYIELKDAIEAINILAIVHHATEKNQNTSRNTTTSPASSSDPLKKLQQSLNDENKDVPKLVNKLIDYFKDNDLPLVRKEYNSNYGQTIYYLDADKKLVFHTGPDNKSIYISFRGKYVAMGREFHQLTLSEITTGRLYHDSEYGVTFDLRRAVKITQTSPSFVITAPTNYSVIGGYPRVTKVSWKHVPNATSYELLVEVSQGEGVSNFNTAKDFVQMGAYKTITNSYTFSGWGGNVHRFRVIARNADNLILETNWNYVSYSQ